MSPGIRPWGRDRQHPRAPNQGGGLGTGPPPSPNISQIHTSTGWPLREGGRGWRKEAQRLWGSWGLKRGPSAQLPPTLPSFLGERPALCPVLPHLPHNGGSPSSDLCRACGPLNKGWPLLVIKISEETLKRKPLGQGLGRPQAALPGEGTGHSSSSGRQPSRAPDQHSAPHPLQELQGPTGGSGRSTAS